MNSPEVSVVLPVYQNHEYLACCLHRIEQEPLPSLEVILIDDGSPTPIPKQTEKKYIRHYRNPRRLGPAASRNLGVKHSCAPLIAFLDSDNLLVHRGIEWRVKYLKQHTDVAAVSGTVRYCIGAQGEVLGDFYQVMKYPNRPTNGLLSYPSFRDGAQMIASPLETTLFRRDFIERVGPLNEQWETGEDREFLYRCVTLESIPMVCQPVLDYRAWSGNLSGQWHRGEFQLSRQAQAEAIAIDSIYLGKGIQ